MTTPPPVPPSVPPFYSIKNEIVRDLANPRAEWIASCRDTFNSDGDKTIDSIVNATDIVARLNAYPALITTLQGLLLEIRKLPASETKALMRRMINAVLKQVPGGLE